MAHVVLRKPACHSTAKSNRPSTRITLEKWRSVSQANKPPLRAGQELVRESAAYTPAIQVDDLTVLAAGEQDAAPEAVVALPADQPGLPQRLEGIAEGRQMAVQTPAGSVADA